MGNRLTGRSCRRKSHRSVGYRSRLASARCGRLPAILDYRCSILALSSRAPPRAAEPRKESAACLGGGGAAHWGGWGTPEKGARGAEKRAYLLFRPATPRLSKTV